MIAALALSFVLQAPAEAQPVDVRAEVERLFEAGRYDEAIERARTEYARTGDPVFLYVEAQAERFRGDCHRAIELYGRVLARTEEGTMAANARDNIEACEAQLREAAASEREDTPKVAPQPAPQPKVEPPPEQPRDAAEPEDGKWWRDPAGGALVGVGGVTLATGIGLVVGGATQRRQGMQASDEASFVDGQRNGGRLMIAGAVVAGVGLALAVGGLVRYAVVGRRLRLQRSAAIGFRF